MGEQTGQHERAEHRARDGAAARATTTRPRSPAPPRPTRARRTSARSRPCTISNAQKAISAVASTPARPRPRIHHANSASAPIEQTRAGYPEPPHAHAEPRERQMEEIVEWRVRVLGAQVGEHRPEWESTGHRGERLVVAEPVGTQAPEPEDGSRHHEDDEHPGRRSRAARARDVRLDCDRRSHDPTVAEPR